MKHEAYLSLAASKGIYDDYPQMIDIFMNSGMGDMYKGQIPQIPIDLSIPDPDNPGKRYHFSKYNDAQSFMTALPNHFVEWERNNTPPYTNSAGYRKIAERILARTPDLVGVLNTYEHTRTGGEDQPVDRQRFDTGRRDYDYNDAEINLATQMHAATRVVAHSLSKGPIQCGFYNTPKGDGDDANWDALRELHTIAGSDFITINANQTRSAVEDADFIHTGIRNMREYLPYLPARVFVSLRDNSQDDGHDSFPKNITHPDRMYAKGRAISDSGSSVIVWFVDSLLVAGENAITESLNALAEGMTA